MKRLILGTAGHIDHGKTALVRALTGTDTDRLPEEKRRGITIDLGFAHFEIGSLGFAVVDVPGHENFIRNMLAGATGLDAVLLVVAADEGVMPQTREHVAILDLLNIRTGIVAITKSDLANPEWLELVRDDVRGLLATTTLADAPIIPVSARTGAGLDELRNAIAECSAPQTGRAADDLFRLPVDRVFTVHGTGTVVTGSIWSGRVEADAQVHVWPGGGRARVRGIQVHGRAAAQTAAGERAALALSGINREDIDRGAVITQTPWPATRILTIAARMIAHTDWTLQQRQRVHVHLGTADVLARVVLLDKDMLHAGDQGWAQLRLESPLVARAGDRVVLRSYSPVTTIGGGIVVELAEKKRSRMGQREAVCLEAVRTGDAAAALAAVARLAGPQGVPLSELPLRIPHAQSMVRETLAAGLADVAILGERAYAADAVAATRLELLAAAAALHERYPLRPQFETAELRSAVRAPAELLEFCLTRLAAAGELATTGSTARLPDFEPRLSPQQTARKESLFHSISAAALAPPSVSELADQGSDAETRALLDLLESEGRVLRIAPDLYVEAAALTGAMARTRQAFEGQASLSANTFRSTLPVTRKHLIPLLEYFDRTGLTVREGDVRSVPVSGRG